MIRSITYLLVAGSALFFSIDTMAAKEALPSEAAHQQWIAEECDAQYRELQKELTRKDWYRKVADESFTEAATILPKDRDPLDVLLRRTRAMLDHRRSLSESDRLVSLAGELDTLTQKAEKIDPTNHSQRRALFQEAFHLRRRLMLSHPALDFEKIVFVKRRLPPLNHMCDQFFGCFQRPGGALCVLEDPFGASPTERNLLAETSVEGGRLDGQKLEGGNFLSPTLSYDGKTIVFAYTQCGLETPDPAPRHWFKTAEWSPELSFHLFRVGTDGTGLRQLTDGPWNDLHPFFLPDGRIVFISERRGGFGRCHARPVPIYTLHAMNRQENHLQRLSHHESNEWYPSVNHDGMIVYTRWDYVDRGFNQAHHPWITTPDGRDPRIIQGNYKESHDDAPNMEMNVLAIPGSRKYLAVAAAHHQVTFGSLILIDPSVPDDDALSAVRRITPDNGFPETAEKGTLKYGTPWPLSEHLYLCSVDRDGSPKNDHRFGLYLVDAFGNRVLLHRNEQFNCTTPLPLRPRPVPPVVPSVGEPVELVDNPRFQRIGEEHAIDLSTPGMTEPATVSLVNVYDSLYPFPEGTEIKQLRIFHLLPKSVANHHDPQIGFGCETGARTVLGTVPVEEDGSAHFLLPPGISVYFQALDENGMAVQSMRSATYVHGGERLVCSGCHEEKARSPLGMVAKSPLAFRRPPSEISPEVAGSHPFSFPRLVQPVLEKHCVECHQQKSGEGAPSLVKGNWKQDPFRWYDSYRNLEPFAFYYGAPRQTGYDAWAPARTIPGKFGAKAAKLTPYLEEDHYGVNLSPQEKRRVTLWLDANSDFFGSYENIDAQADGQLIFPTIR